MKRIVVFILAGFVFSQAAFAQNKSNRGKEFWLGYGFDYSFQNESPVNAQELALYISTTQAATVTVSINTTGWTQTLNIPANTVDATILIPKSGPNDARMLTDGLSTRGIHIVSDVPVAVYAHVYALEVSGATMLMPVETYGYTYYSINYSQATSGSQLPAINPNTQNGPDWYSWFYVVAAENNTRLEITPSDTTKNGWLPNQTYTVNLNKGEIYNVFGKMSAGSQAWAASKDMTGSKIVSVTGADGNCHPVGVFSGSGGIRFCRGDGGEFMHQQIFPAQAWGTRYLTYHMMNNTNTNINATFRNYYRVCVTDPATVVKRNGVTLSGIVKNFYYEFVDSTGGDYITADKPILVAQYTPNKNQCWNFNPVSYGDPEMFYLSPIEQGQKSVLFYSSSHFGIDYVYSNILVPTAGISSLLVDGAPLPVSQIKLHPNNPAYSLAVANLSNLDLQHTITSDSAFTATVYGIGYFESYGYNVGTLINNLNAIGEIKNVLGATVGPDSFTCKTTPFRLSIKVAYPLTSIHWKLSQVAGMSPNTDSVINAPVATATQTINGRTYYTYTLQQDFTISTPGTYYLPVTYSANEIDNCSHVETYNIEIIVKAGPVADFTASSANCLKDTIHFTHIPVTGPYTFGTYLWNFDDGSTQNTVDANKLFSTTGIQNVRYRIYATNGCTGDTTKIFTISASPTAVIGASTPACASDSILISDTSAITSGSITSWHYDFGDATSLIRNINTPFYHTYILPGTYTIKLVTTSNNGCPSDTGYKTVTVFAKPIAKFGYTLNICSRDSVYITDTSSVATGTITGWHYDFGDGNTLIRNTNTAFYHPYNLPGSYVISLVTISNNGCTSDTFRRTVNVGDKPLADFSVPALNCLNDTVYFTHIPPAGSFTITGYLWNFDDGSTQNTIDAKKKFTTAGIQNIRYRIFTASGCTGDTTRIITISESPVARLGVTLTPCVDSVMISDTSSIASGSISSWYYDFGDGNTLARNTNTNFYHKYLSQGTYTIKLVTTSALGCKSDTSKRIITITAKPLSDFTVSALNCSNDTIYFSHVNPPGTFNITGYLWNFDDGSTQNSIDAKKKFTIAGIQNIRYRVFADNGCTGDITKTITISASPIARLGAISPLCAVDSVLVSDTSSIATGSIVSWHYDFGDGNTLVRSVNTNFYHKYLFPGTYTISLVTISDMGCKSDTSKRIVNIATKPTVSASYTGNACVGSVINFTSSYTAAGSNTWYWNFGDAQTVNITTGNTTTHIYTSAQTPVIVKHVVINAQGCASDTAQIIIPAINLTPVASFSIVKDTVCENKPVLFTSTVTGVSNWNWSFGNGSSAATPPLYRTYTTAGTYNVSLVVTSNGCKSLPATDFLIVRTTPKVNAGIDKTKGSAGTVLLDASVTPPSAYKYLWTPAIGMSASNILQPYAGPLVSTTYTLKVEDVNTHCIASDDVNVKVIPDIYIPNAFVPSGSNSHWVIPALAFFPGAVVSVYNRYGEVILMRSNYSSNPWDGTYKGAKQPMGAYTYLINLNDDKKQIFLGVVTLIR